MAIADHEFIKPDGPVSPDGLVPIRFRFPGGELLRKAGYEPDLGLQISHLYFRVREKPGNGNGMNISLSSSGSLGVGVTMFPKRKVLHLSGTFLIWDYRIGTAVAFGWLETGTDFRFMMKKSDWVNVVSDATESIIKNTPLKGKKYQERKVQAGQFKGNHALGYQ